jgi:hypothetical protein
MAVFGSQKGVYFPFWGQNSKSTIWEYLIDFFISSERNNFFKDPMQNLGPIAQTVLKL